MTVKISDGELCTDHQEIITFSNAATGERQALTGFHIEFSVEVRGQCFTVIFQDADRSNNLEAYNGYEVAPGCTMGCEADEYTKLEAFIESLEDTSVEEEGLLWMLKRRAEIAAESELEGGQV